MVRLITVLGGALLFLWPAILNGYPLLFSDTSNFLNQALAPDIGFDKPWIYGPFLTPFHWRITLWPAIGAQAVILSAMLWITQATLSAPSKTRHLALCAILAIATAAPWFASELMPDIFASVTVLGLFILAENRVPRATLAWVAVVTTIAIASHLAHLVLAAACIVTLGLIRWRLPWRPATSLAAALLLLVATNVVGRSRIAVSPYGSLFALARLVGDGTARTYLQQACPMPGIRLCDWKDRLPTDSDAFLWDPNSPLWADAAGPTGYLTEASSIVANTILTQPVPVLGDAIRNTFQQLLRVKVGDAIIPDYLDITVLPLLKEYFPADEVARYRNALQPKGELPALAQHFYILHLATLTAGTLATLWIAIRHWRTNRAAAVLAVLVLIALAANAFSTGALSGPHDRYQARIAWIVVIPPLLTLRAPRRVRSELQPSFAHPLPPPVAAGSSAG